MKILVTGGTGLVGKRLLKHLIPAGFQCRAIVRKGKTLPDNIEVIEADILDESTLEEAIKDVSAIIHLAAVLRSSEEELIWKVNYEGTKNLINATLNYAPQARFIMASTGLVYDDNLSNPATENDATCSDKAYPASKLAAEKLLQESGLNWSILRFAFVYGDGDDHLDKAPKLLSSWNWHPAQRLSLIHHHDIANAMILALKGTMDRHIVNISDDAPISLYEIGNIVKAKIKPSAEPLLKPWVGLIDGSLARALGFTPHVATLYQAQREHLM